MTGPRTRITLALALALLALTLPATPAEAQHAGDEASATQWLQLVPKTGAGSSAVMVGLHVEARTRWHVAPAIQVNHLFIRGSCALIAPCFDSGTALTAGVNLHIPSETAVLHPFIGAEIGGVWRRDGFEGDISRDPIGYVRAGGEVIYSPSLAVRVETGYTRLLSASGREGWWPPLHFAVGLRLAPFARR